MSTTPRRFGVVSNDDRPPVEFELADDKGRSLGVFHATDKPRLDLAEAMARAVSLNAGIRVYDVNILTYCLREFLIREKRVEVGTGDDGAPMMEWVKADDVERFDEIVRSDRVHIQIETLGEIVMWLLEETVKHPTGGSGRSSAGPTSTPPGSKGNSVSVV